MKRLFPISQWLIIFTSTLAAFLSGCSSSSSYEGSGGRFFGTPNRELVDSGRIDFHAERFAKYKVHSTTKTEIVNDLGSPAGWISHPDGTQELEYDFVEPGGKNDLRKIIYVIFEFDKDRVLILKTYPGAQN